MLWLNPTGFLSALRHHLHHVAVLVEAIPCASGPKFAGKGGGGKISPVAPGCPPGKAAAESEQITYTRHKHRQPEKPPVRAPLPAHLPRQEIVIDPETDTSVLEKIGEAITEELCQRHALGRI